MSINREDAFLSIKTILNETLKERIDTSLVSEHTNLIKEIGLSSLEGLEILVKIENEFDIEIEDEDLSLELMSTISNLIDYVENKKMQLVGNEQE